MLVGHGVDYRLTRRCVARGGQAAGADGGKRGIVSVCRGEADGRGNGIARAAMHCESGVGLLLGVCAGRHCQAGSARRTGGRDLHD